MIKIGIVLASIRKGHNGHVIGEWLNDFVARRSDSGVEYEMVSLADYDLPFLVTMPALSSDESVLAWKEKMNGFDGFIYITPEFNKSVHGVLKNALDYLQEEVHNKVVGYVGYGLLGGASAVQSLRIINGQQQMASVQSQVNINVGDQIDEDNKLTLNTGQVDSAHLMLDQLISWTTKFKQ